MALVAKMVLKNSISLIYYVGPWCVRGTAVCYGGYEGVEVGAPFYTLGGTI